MFMHARPLCALINLIWFDLIYGTEEWRSLTIQPHRRQPPGEWRTGEKKKKERFTTLYKFDRSRCVAWTENVNEWVNVPGDT